MMRLLVAVLACLWCVCVQGAVLTISGGDPGAGAGDSRTRADEAAARFDRWLGGPPAVVSFEGLESSFVNPLTVARGVSVSFANADPLVNVINTSSDVLTGYNTTPGGSNFLRVDSDQTNRPVEAVFTFARPIQAFGGYFTGLGNATGGVSLRYVDEAGEQEIQLAAPGSNLRGGVDFFGLRAPGRSITSVTVRVANQRGRSFDVIGLDDVRLEPSMTASPEPSSLLLTGAAAGVLAVRLRRR